MGKQARISDRDVELMRRLNENGVSYAVIARCFEENERYVRQICLYERRHNVIVAKWRE